MKAWEKDQPLATFVRQRRKEAGLTQAGLADLTGLGLRFIRDLEQGKPSLRMDKVNQLLLFFGHTLTPQPLNDAQRQRLGE